MAISFEKLERRDLLTRLSIDIDGPIIVRSGEEVTYTVRLTNAYGIELDFHPEVFWTELDEVQLSLDGQPWSIDTSGETTFRLSPNATAVIEASGRAPDKDYFVFETSMTTTIKSLPAINAGLSTYVFDRFADELTIGSEVRTINLEQGFRISSGLQNLLGIHAEDVDADGLNDVAVDFVDGSNDLGHTYRYTVYGSEIVNLQTASEFFARVKDSERVDPSQLRTLVSHSHTETQDIDIGDVDGDGYGDIIRTNRRAASNSGTATIFFGPDHRENYIIFGSAFVGRSGGSSFFGSAAGPLGDVNGDGFNEFFVIDWSHQINAFFGRDFGRNPTGDVNRDGTVDFNDFLVLADNFDRETNDRALGELDGDGRVTFLDFLLLAENFSKSADSGK